MDRLTRTVREQVALGRLLPLGAPGDTAWITESAAVRVLRESCAKLPGVRLGNVSILLDQPGDGDTPYEVPGAAPVGALPHVPLRIEAAFDAAVDEPLPLAADRLRETLWRAARSDLGLTVGAVDLEVVGLLDGEAAFGGGAAAGPAARAAAPGQLAEIERPAEGPGEGPGGEPAGEPADFGATVAVVADGGSAAVETAALAVPGVTGLTRRLAGLGSGVRVQDGTEDVPGRRVQVQIAVAPGHVPLTVAREVADAVTTAAAPGATGPVTAAVVVTDAG